MLVAILYIQFGGGGEKPAGEPTGYRPPRPARGRATGELDGETRDAGVCEDADECTSRVRIKSAAAAPLIDETRWKSPKLETIVAYDPFALPPSFPQPPKVTAGGKAIGADGLIAAAAADDAKKMAEAVEKQRMELEELKQRGVHVILRKGDQYVAVIGDRMLHVGDKINEFTVTAIDPDDGVHIERKESP